ncbi:MAG: DUF2147 domain-containing protein [Acidocella sp.]|nr:DUF2147 domain-containing protein [Acidocella sp.]
MFRANLQIKLFTAFVLTFGLWLGGISASCAQAAGDATGWWLDQSSRAGILIAPCGGQLCGRIEWLLHPLNDAGQPKADIHNNDPSLRARRLCGLPMLGNFSTDGVGAWSGGWIYDPEKGKTYKSVMHIADDGTLHVRGYIGIPMFGRSEVWTRPPAPLAPCAGG